MQGNERRGAGCVCAKYTALLSENARLEGALAKEKAENARLRAELGRQKRTAKERPWGQSTPSSQQLVKPSAPPPADGAEARRKMGGAKKGHEGHGWRDVDDDFEVEEVPLEAPERCPECGGGLVEAPFEGRETRDVVEVRPVKAYVRRYVRRVMKCAECGRIVRARVPGVMDGCRYGNSALARAATDFYLHGTPAGVVERRTGIAKGTLFQAFGRLARLLSPAREGLFEVVRSSPLAQGDETPWRTDGRNGYAWTFIAGNAVTFVCADTRGSSVPKSVIGDFGGVFVSDRYNGYEYIPGQRAWCLET